MLTVLLRTLIVYLLLIGTMRLMGKRQLGELEISELVTTLLISEIASLPIENPNIPVVVVIIPLITILTLEVSLSVILLKCPRLKNLASTRPSILIRHGRIDQKEMRRIRISIDELISEIRQAGIASLSDVDYAILEQNGKISVIARRSAQPPSADDLGLDLPENGIIHILIEDGRCNRYNMELLQLHQSDIEKLLKERKTRRENVFLLGMDDAGELYWIEKENNA
jgi:uncharacterized membrane protein YcaP (DUF421 family)